MVSLFFCLKAFANATKLDLFDRPSLLWDKHLVKAAKRVSEKKKKKTPGTLAVERHRPLMNKLTIAQRRRLRDRAAELLYGREALAPGR